MSLVDFTGPSLIAHEVLFISLMYTAMLPWLQYSGDSGDACCIGAPSTQSGVKGLAIYRSDNATLLLAGPADATPREAFVPSIGKHERFTPRQGTQFRHQLSGLAPGHLVVTHIHK